MKYKLSLDIIKVVFFLFVVIVFIIIKQKRKHESKKIEYAFTILKSKSVSDIDDIIKHESQFYSKGSSVHNPQDTEKLLNYIKKAK
ncbi:MAG: hypothetical protein ACI81T_000742 [Bacteroidia bacterium]|jgi:hypothetical protein